MVNDGLADENAMLSVGYMERLFSEAHPIMQHLKSNTRIKHGQSRTEYLDVPLLRDKRHSLFVEKMSWYLHCPLKENRSRIIFSIDNPL